MPSFPKAPIEIYSIGFDFVGKLPPGATLSSVLLSAIDLEDGSDQTSSVLQSPTGTVSGTQALGRMLAGLDGHNYRIRFVVTLNTGDVLKQDVLALVRD